ncbi:unannotated protein [freshwater metagenome]|uniref:Unannotated protein n=1 Tax=freshwater metagenome TaxID=449393 RepID=A0A6J6Z4J7_9ZZZZ
MLQIPQFVPIQGFGHSYTSSRCARCGLTLNAALTDAFGGTSATALAFAVAMAQPPGVSRFPNRMSRYPSELV